MTPSSAYLGQEDLADATEISPEAFDRLADYITRELGIKMSDAKLTMVQSRLLRRVRELGLKSVEEYGNYLLASPNGEEREKFINAITTNKTDFFREPPHFEYLAKVVLPALAQTPRRYPGWRLKAWSAGCSSGEEPYTLAMVLSEHVQRDPGMDFAILGTDVSTKVLERARAGIYADSEILPIPGELRQKYFWKSRNPQEALVRVIPDLRRRVSFSALNFMDAEYRMNDVFDIVFFRNVMIYFDRPTQEAVVNKICSHLVPGGYLFVGHSETLTGLNVPVKLVRTSVFRKPLT